MIRIKTKNRDKKIGGPGSAEVSNTIQPSKGSEGCYKVPQTNADNNRAPKFQAGSTYRVVSALIAVICDNLLVSVICSVILIVTFDYVSVDTFVAVWTRRWWLVDGTTVLQSESQKLSSILSKLWGLMLSVNLSSLITYSFKHFLYKFILYNYILRISNLVSKVTYVTFYKICIP